MSDQLHKLYETTQDYLKPLNSLKVRLEGRMIAYKVLQEANDALLKSYRPFPNTEQDALLANKPEQENVDYQ